MYSVLQRDGSNWAGSFRSTSAPARCAAAYAASWPVALTTMCASAGCDAPPAVARLLLLLPRAPRAFPAALRSTTTRSLTSSPSSVTPTMSSAASLCEAAGRAEAQEEAEERAATGGEGAGCPSSGAPVVHVPIRPRCCSASWMASPSPVGPRWRAAGRDDTSSCAPSVAMASATPSALLALCLGRLGEPLSCMAACFPTLAAAVLLLALAVASTMTPRYSPPRPDASGVNASASRTSRPAPE